MASVKVVLRKKQNKDGSYPLAVRITKDRKSSFVHVGHHVSELQWDSTKGRVKKNHPNSVRLNNLLSKKLAEAEDSLLDLEVTKTDTSSLAIKRKLRAPKEASFFAQADIRLKNLRKQGKYNMYKSDLSRTKTFKKFLNDSDISFKDISVALLNRYRAYLKGTKNVSELTVVGYLTFIQTVFNQAIRENIVEQKYYPFGKDKIRFKAPQSLKIGLSREEVMLIHDMALPEDSYLHHVRNIWLISFYFAGMRISDTLRLKWTDFQNDRLYYAMGKNAKGGSLKIPEKADKILGVYRENKNNHDLVFSELSDLPDLNDKFEVQKRIAVVNRGLNVALREIAEKAGITKKLTMHISRHTFGNISGDKIPIQMLQKLYRHSDITTTIGYQANFIHKDADEALDAVIGF